MTQMDKQLKLIENISNDDLKLFFNTNKDILQLPIEVNNGVDVFVVLYERWNRYCELISNTEWLSDSLSVIKSYIRDIKRTIKFYFAGDLLKANNIIKRLLNKITTNPCVCHIEDLYCDAESLHWFRARTSDYTPLNSKDMKHIPFSKRSIITDQRYSINGIPCLYLGSSVMVCWEELNRPTPDTLWVNRYMQNQAYNSALRILNFSTTAHMLGNFDVYIGGHFNRAAFLKNFFEIWILQSACSVTVKEQKRSFIAEYVIPQLIMQNIKSAGIDGVMYFSVKMKNAYYTPCGWIARNLAIPAFDENKSDYSQEIDKIFRMSEPINVGMFNNGIIAATTPHIEPNTNFARTNASVFISDEEYNKYDTTIFYKVEYELLQRLFNK